MLEDRGVKPGDRLALALEEVDLGLHEGRLAGDVHEDVGLISDLLRGATGGDGELLGGLRELLGGGGPAGLVAGSLGLRLLDEQLDLVDLVLDGGGFRDETTGELLRRSSCGGAGRSEDLSPPAS